MGLLLAPEPYIEEGDYLGRISRNPPNNNMAALGTGPITRSTYIYYDRQVSGEIIQPAGSAGKALPSEGSRRLVSGQALPQSRYLVITIRQLIEQ